MANGNVIGMPPLNKFQGITASDLMQLEFAEPKWAIPNILPEGLSILGGKPKKGKYVLAMNICLAIAGGWEVFGAIPVTQGTVLYYALEDSHRRLQNRILKMLQGKPAPEKLVLFNQLPRVDEGGLDHIRREIAKYDDIRLIVIDTLIKFRAVGNSRANNLYEDDYLQISRIKDFADEHNIPILLVHHMSKREADDAMDLFSGSHGLTGAADTLLALVTKSGQGPSYLTLQITGRDVETDEQAIELDTDSLTWKLLGAAQGMQATNKQRAVVDAIRNAASPIGPKEIAEATTFDAQYIRNILPKLVEEGSIKKQDRGKYEINKI